MPDFDASGADFQGVRSVAVTGNKIKQDNKPSVKMTNSSLEKSRLIAKLRTENFSLKGVESENQTLKSKVKQLSGTVAQT